jgi:hypothetical protein
MRLKWLGLGTLYNVPGRDLSEEEAARFGERRLLASGLYERIKEKKAAPIETAAAGEEDNGRS